MINDENLGGVLNEASRVISQNEISKRAQRNNNNDNNGGKSLLMNAVRVLSPDT